MDRLSVSLQIILCSESVPTITAWIVAPIRSGVLSFMFPIRCQLVNEEDHLEHTLRHSDS